MQVDTTARLLAAASAIIPIFGFPDWEWDQINEVLVYPTRFDSKFQFGDEQGPQHPRNRRDGKPEPANDPVQA